MKKLSRYIIVEKSYCSGGLFLRGEDSYPKLFTHKELQETIKGNEDIFTVLPIQVSRMEVENQNKLTG